MKNVQLTLIALLLLSLFGQPPSRAESIVPDRDCSTSGLEAGRVGRFMTICPAGDTHSLQSADAVVFVELKDADCNPLTNYPLQDMWLKEAGGAPSDLVEFCKGGNFADSNTDSSGRARFSHVLPGGGHTIKHLKVYAGGVPIRGDVMLNVASPDITRDLRVDLVDIGMFTEDFRAGYAGDLQSDLNGDKRLNLSDVAILAQHVGHGCSN